jgi:hypothetical protein
MKVATDQIHSNSDPYNAAHKVCQDSLTLHSISTAAETETWSAAQKRAAKTFNRKDRQNQTQLVNKR